MYSKSQLFILLTFMFAAPFASALNMASIPEKADDVQPIAVGETLPSLVFTTKDEKKFELDKVFDKSAVLLIFYRGGWCPYCNTHLAELRKIEKQIDDLGIKMFAISPDQPKYLRETDERHKPAYTLLSDSSMESTAAVGLAYKVGKLTRAKFKVGGIKEPLVKSMYTLRNL